MERRRTYVSRMCRSLLTLLLLEYLYSFYLDGSLLLLIFRALGYYNQTLLLAYRASKDGGDGADVTASPAMRGRRLGHGSSGEGQQQQQPSVLRVDSTAASPPRRPHHNNDDDDDDIRTSFEYNYMAAVMQRELTTPQPPIGSRATSDSDGEHDVVVTPPPTAPAAAAVAATRAAAPSTAPTYTTTDAAAAADVPAAVRVMQVSSELEAKYNATRMQLWLHCVLRYGVVVLLHVMWLGRRYVNATPLRGALAAAAAADEAAQRNTTGHDRHDNSSTAAAAAAAAVLASQYMIELLFWRGYVRSVRFFTFTAAWEPFAPVPCVLLLLDVALLLLEYVTYLLCSVHGDTVALASPVTTTAAAAAIASSTSARELDDIAVRTQQQQQRRHRSHVASHRARTPLSSQQQLRAQPLSAAATASSVLVPVSYEGVAAASGAMLVHRGGNNNNSSSSGNSNSGSSHGSSPSNTLASAQSWRHQQQHDHDEHNDSDVDAQHMLAADTPPQQQQQQQQQRRRHHTTYRAVSEADADEAHAARHDDDNHALPPEEQQHGSVAAYVDNDVGDGVAVATSSSLSNASSPLLASAAAPQLSRIAVAAAAHVDGRRGDGNGDSVLRHRRTGCTASVRRVLCAVYDVLFTGWRHELLVLLPPPSPPQPPSLSLANDNDVDDNNDACMLSPPRHSRASSLTTSQTSASSSPSLTRRRADVDKDSITQHERAARGRSSVAAGVVVSTASHDIHDVQQQRIRELEQQLRRWRTCALRLAVHKQRNNNESERHSCASPARSQPTVPLSSSSPPLLTSDDVEVVETASARVTTALRTCWHVAHELCEQHDSRYKESDCSTHCCACRHPRDSDGIRAVEHDNDDSNNDDVQTAAEDVCGNDRSRQLQSSCSSSRDNVRQTSASATTSKATLQRVVAQLHRAMHMATMTTATLQCIATMSSSHVATTTTTSAAADTTSTRACASCNVLRSYNRALHTALCERDDAAAVLRHERVTLQRRIDELQCALHACRGHDNSNENNKKSDSTQRTRQTTTTRHATPSRVLFVQPSALSLLSSLPSPPLTTRTARSLSSREDAQAVALRHGRRVHTVLAPEQLMHTP